ncbi:glutamate 5-kinase [Aurantimonas sp. C2-6-R+9]|uniref:glutamate 5-kinase n=1 Tax=unclassified Aurantimonas TaxID=2638230 RepID=UPI002E16C7C1|nr:MULTISPECIES: glutamate 5-kinase [unclassified Aurantimonas]MEC5290906.1 glutamate 5-kinase [Aurantimonas sp. C2-3-R2]MEC5381083.1 glutamate 5-kinase [Aurantimonas sp. C2-6-R+9]MEC5412056.1 glutamate 5-kinase [Aurantimonas sp. C2-4-R8]
MTDLLDGYTRIVVKIGSSLLVDPQSGLKRTWLESLGEDIARLSGEGRQILVVSSGAIALGRKLLKMPAGPLRLEESQAAAAVGQIALSRTYSEILGRHGIETGQILLTLGDTEERRRYLNARATISTLLGFGALPVINENDTVATSEIRYGDNDRLAARVATMMGADLLILLSDVDGLYTAPPALDPAARHIPLVERITPDIEAMAGAAGSELSRGGMKTKIDAGKIATGSGAAMIITAGDRLFPLSAIERGERATLFRAADNPVTARKRWIAGHLGSTGELVVDAGAVKALCAGKSLLPAGIVSVDGEFRRGDTIAVTGPDGRRIARGLVAYDAVDARRIAGLRSAEVATALGYEGRTAMIHRDDLVMEAAAEPADESLRIA